VGANERDLFPLAPDLDPRLRILSLRAPLTRAADARAEQLRLVHGQLPADWIQDRAGATGRQS